MKAPLPGALATRVVRWQASHGRQHLPWQNTRDPYRIWLSEVMLQQTQVATVRDYFSRFLARFPNVAALAGASIDEVLALWSGLGYYSRARNLHRCAAEIVESWGGVFPRTAQALAGLPGIGRSTAAAIASLCFAERAAILDANVKRVLTRVLAFDGDLSLQANQRRLWAQATDLLPTRDLERSMPRYTQGMMDLGATVCVAREPSCGVCPLSEICVARRSGTQASYPVSARKIKRTAQSLWLLWARTNANSVWLQRRPIKGVWAGLFCMPCFDSREELAAAVPLRFRPALRDQQPFKHVLTHKDLHLHLVQLLLPAPSVSSAPGEWFGAHAWPALGLPAPIRRILVQAGSQPKVVVG